MKEKKKCDKCNKNVHLYGIICKCKNTYCYLCLDINNHNCQYDYQSENKKKLKENNKLIITDKITKI
jgi:hypothetical protein